MPRGIKNQPAALTPLQEGLAQLERIKAVKRAIRRYVAAEIDWSWHGNQDPIYYDDIKHELNESRHRLDLVLDALTSPLKAAKPKRKYQRRKPKNEPIAGSNITVGEWPNSKAGG